MQTNDETTTIKSTNRFEALPPDINGEENESSQNGSPSNESRPPPNPEEMEEIFSQFQNIVTLRELKTFCSTNNFHIPRGMTFQNLKRHIGKKYDKHFQPVREKHQQLLDDQYKPPFDYYVVLDFECTCWKEEQRRPEDEDPKETYTQKRLRKRREAPKRRIQEIIEFPAVLVDTNNGDIIDTFQEYVKPMIHPNISEFCTELTGITQDDVDNGKTFPEALNLFLEWLNKHGLDDPTKYLIITDGRADIRDFLNGTLVIYDLPFPHQLRTFADLKLLFSRFHGGAIKLDAMLKFYEIEFEGQKHCGLDDAKNIARLAMKMTSRHTQLIPTNRMIPRDFVDDYKNAREIKFSCDLERKAFAYSRITTKLYREKSYLQCDDCKQGSCEAAKFYKF